MSSPHCVSNSSIVVSLAVYVNSSTTPASTAITPSEIVQIPSNVDNQRPNRSSALGAPTSPIAGSCSGSVVVGSVVVGRVVVGPSGESILRQFGELKKLQYQPLTADQTAKLVNEILTPEQRTAKLAEIFETLSRAYYFMGDSHIRLEGQDDEMNDAMMAVFEKGVTASEKAIALRDPEFAAKVASDRNNWKSAVSTAKKEALPALYWYSTNLGKWALLEGIATILSRKDDIKATMDWVVANDATYFYAAPYRYFGAFHTKVPIGGGNPKASLESFDKSIEVAPNYLATKVLKAEQYAVLIGDRDLYESLLNEVLNADPSLAPEIAPENELEKRKAKRMLANADEFFY